MKGTPQRLAWSLQDNILKIHVNKDCKDLRFNRVIDGVENITHSRRYSIIIEIGRAFLLPVCRQGTINRIIEEIMTIVFLGDGSHVDVINMDEMEKETKKTEETVD